MGEKLGGRKTPVKTQEKIPAPKVRPSMMDYEKVKQELENMKQNAVYSEKQKPRLPSNSNTQEIAGQLFFTGFNNQIGAMAFCYGILILPKENIKQKEYRYLSQDYFDKMIEKFKEALGVLKQISSSDPEKLYPQSLKQ